MAFPGGETARIETSMATGQKFEAWLKIEGAQGRLEMINPLNPHTGHKITTIINGETHSFTEPGETTYDHQLSHMIAVLKGETLALTGGRDAVANMRAIDAIYRAAGLKPRGA